MNSAEQILDNIFTVMERLYDEMRLNRDGRNNHLRVFEIFAELGRTLAGADRASFWRWDRHNHKLLTTAATDSEQIVIDEKSGLVGRAISENRTLVTNDPYNHPDFNAAVDKMTGYVTKSVLVMPVANCRGEIIGAFQVINKLDSETGFDEISDVKRLSIAAFICGMALESDIFFADSQHDKLTGLKNRFGLNDDFSTRYEKLLREGTPLAMIMCDIDFFKRVNDTFGHNAGDAILKHVAKILRDSIDKLDDAYRWGGEQRDVASNLDNRSAFPSRESSSDAYRWGGEEFILILANATIDDAKIVAERIRSTVMNSVCNFDGDALKITMSFGCSEISAALSIEDNVKIADERLYRAKQTGRNKVVADPL
ncbi:MAG: sensor domain-containing diguanylate cyclase [Selenomonadaceae bacterium]|nr:sensor domain-containing diguanylate cyclase [Selenomonadaceae bacterium]